jgi:tRNA nucleotidyltransferase/poly(A) polymerase
MARLEIDRKAHPSAREVVAALREAGHEAWLAGGCVRDLILGREPADYDVASSATAEEVRNVFRRTVPVKPELGVTLVLRGEDRIEVTTFRTEGPYLDGRRPSRVGPASAELDVRRRDFTINGLLLDPLSGEIFDHVGGLADLEAGILRCIGDPGERFAEDHLRILRAVRFAVRFDLSIDPSTWAAMLRLSHRVDQLSGERIHEELEKMFGQGPFHRCLDLLLESGVLGSISPPLALALGSVRARDRLARWCRSRLPAVQGLWPAFLGMPLCPWFEEFQPGPTAAVQPAQERYLERIRASRTEIDAAALVWTRWPRLHAPLPLPSALAPMFRDRNWTVLRTLLETQVQAGLEPLPPLEELDRIQERVPLAPPALGHAFQKAGVPKGPLLGQAIREADRRILDEGDVPGAQLVAQVAKSIMGGP